MYSPRPSNSGSRMLKSRQMDLEDETWKMSFAVKSRHTVSAIFPFCCGGTGK